VARFYGSRKRAHMHVVTNALSPIYSDTTRRLVEWGRVAINGALR